MFEILKIVIYEREHLNKCTFEEEKIRKIVKEREEIKERKRKFV